MAHKYLKNLFQYETINLSKKLALGGLQHYLPISFFLRFKMDASGPSPTNNGVLSFANDIATDSYTTLQLIASPIGNLQYYTRGLSSALFTATALGDVRGDGKWHTFIASYRQREDIPTALRSRIFFDGDTHVFSEANAGGPDVIDGYHRFGFGLGDYASTPNDWANCQVAEFAVWHADLQQVDANCLFYKQLSALWVQPEALISYVVFEGDHLFDVVSGTPVVKTVGLPTRTASPGIIYPPGFSVLSKTVVNPVTLVRGGYHAKRLRQAHVPTASQAIVSPFGEGRISPAYVAPRAVAY